MAKLKYKEFEIEVDYRSTTKIKVRAKTVATAHGLAEKAAEELPGFIWVNELTTVSVSEIQEGHQENGKE